MRIPMGLANSMQYPIKTLALQTVELTFAAALMAVVLAVTLPRLGPDRFHLALAFYSALAVLPTAAIAFGCIWRRPWPRAVGWMTLSLFTVAFVSFS